MKKRLFDLIVDWIMIFRLILVVFLVCLSTILFVNESNAQNRRIKKKTTKVSKTKNKVNERRKFVESLLLKGEYHHDGSEELIYIGTIESVPSLFKVLEDNPPKISKPLKGIGQNNGGDEIPSPSKKTYLCTYFHAVTALRKITGQKFVELEDWKNWWENYLKNKMSKTK